VCVCVCVCVEENKHTKSRKQSLRVGDICVKWPSLCGDRCEETAFTQKLSWLQVKAIFFSGRSRFRPEAATHVHRVTEERER